MSPSRKSGLGFVLVTLFMSMLGIGLVIPILPNLVKSLAGGDTSYGARIYGAFVITYAVVQFFFSPVLGSLSDRVGRRPVLILSALGQGLDYLLLAFAPSLEWLFLGRVVAGLTGASIATATAYIADVSPPEKQAQNFGLVGVAFGLGFITGPFLGGFLGTVDLRLPFIVASGLTLANALYGYFVLPESLLPQNRRAFSWNNANPVGALWAFRRYPAVVALFVALFFWGLAQRGLESCWVLYTGHRYGWGLRDAAISLTSIGMVAAVVQGVLVKRFVKWLGEQKTFLLGLSIGAVIFVAYGLLTHGDWAFWIFPLGAFTTLSGPASQALLSKAVPPSEQGLLQGGVASVMSLTQIVGPVMATQLLGFFISDDAPFYVPGMPFFVCSAFFVAAIAVAVATFRKYSL